MQCHGADSETRTLEVRGGRPQSGASCGDSARASASQLGPLASGLSQQNCSPMHPQGPAASGACQHLVGTEHRSPSARGTQGDKAPHGESPRPGGPGTAGLSAGHRPGGGAQESGSRPAHVLTWLAAQASALCTHACAPGLGPPAGAHGRSVCCSQGYEEARVHLTWRPSASHSPGPATSSARNWLGTDCPPAPRCC